MSVSMIIRSVLLLMLVVYLVVKHRQRKTKVTGPRISKAKQKATAQKDRKKEWKKKRHAASRKKGKEAEEEKWRKMLLEALPSGLSRSTTMVGDLKIGVMEGGQGSGRSTVLLLHGLASDKEIWAEFCHQLLSEGCHVVAIDLPGFGDSVASPKLSYDIASQAKRVKSFIEARRLRNYHVIGHSIGAAIGAACACMPKSGVASLTMIEPIGIRTPEASELDRQIAQGENPFTFTEASGYRTLLQLLCAEMPSIHEAIYANRSVGLAKRAEISKAVWRDTREGDGAWVLDLLLPEVPQRTLGIFGAESKVLHALTRDHMSRRMRQAQAVSLDDCGHLPMLEQPEKTASYFLRFQQAIQAAAI